MARQHTQDERHDTRTDPPPDRHEPPCAVVGRRARSLALGVFLGGLLVLCLAIGLALLLRWAWPERDVARIDTVERVPPSLAQVRLPGGTNPAPTPATTAAEFTHRGVGLSIRGPMPPLLPATPITSLREIVELSPVDLAGRRLELEDVEVESRDGDTLWVRDEAARVALVVPEVPDAIGVGSHVDIGGVVERTPSGAVRMRATRVDVSPGFRTQDSGFRG